MPSSDLELQKNALNTETRIATHSIKVRKAMLTGIPNTRNSTTKERVFHKVRKYISCDFCDICKGCFQLVTFAIFAIFADISGLLLASSLPKS